MKKVFKWCYKWIAIIWLMIVYMTMRITRILFWEVNIDPFGVWIHFNEDILRDTAIFVVLAVSTAGFIFLSWIWFLIVLAVLLVNIIVSILYVRRKAKREGRSFNEAASIIKSSIKIRK